MPLYDYELSATKEKFEVMHSINRKIATWGDLCQELGLPMGKTDPSTLVSRIWNGRVFVNGNLEDLSKGKVIQKG
jgi:hypothetical protein